MIEDSVKATSLDPETLNKMEEKSEDVVTSISKADTPAKSFPIAAIAVGLGLLAGAYYLLRGNKYADAEE